MRNSLALLGLLLVSVGCSNFQKKPEQVASTVATQTDGPSRNVAQVAPTCVDEGTVVSKVNQDLNLVVRSQGPVEAFGSGQRNCVQNVLSSPLAQRLLDDCNARAFYVKRCSVIALPGATFGPLTTLTQTFEGTAHKKNCGGQVDHACGQPLCVADLNTKVTQFQNSCQRNYNNRCDITASGNVTHSFRDSRFRCSQSVSITPVIPDGVSCRVMLEARNAVSESPRQ